MLYRDTSAIDAVNEGRDTPTWVFIGSNRVAKFGWKSTDAWRGYTTITAVKKHGWEPVTVDNLPGWVTGDWDDAPAGAAISDHDTAIEHLAKELDREGYDTLIVYAPTSNVFSTTWELFKKKRGKLETTKRRKIANNTYLIDNGKRRAIRLHSTDIATEAGPGKLRIDTGGWDTVTTRERLHRFTSCRVYRDKGTTYIDGEKLRDGMIVTGSLSV